MLFVDHEQAQQATGFEAKGALALFLEVTLVVAKEWMVLKFQSFACPRFWQYSPQKG